MKKYDPAGTFMNKFGQRILGSSDAMDVDPQVTHCALQDYCTCITASDCAEFQICTQIDGFNVCMDEFPSIPQILEFTNLANLSHIIEVCGIVVDLEDAAVYVEDAVVDVKDYVEDAAVDVKDDVENWWTRFKNWF
jgi:hypothetical protein